MSSNGTANGNGAGGGSRGPPSLDSIIWMGLGTNPATMTLWSALGAVGVGIIVSQILADTGRYFDHFSSDSRWLKLGVATGSILALGDLMLVTAQTYELIHHAFIEGYSTIMRFDSFANTSSDLLGGFFCLATTMYYTYRAWRLSGRKIWLAISLGILNFASFALSLAVVTTGFMLPPITLAGARNLQAFNVGRVPLLKAWGGVVLVGDFAICVAMMYLLFKKKDSVFHNEKKLYRKLNTIIVETMLPPVICVLILNCATDIKTAAPADFRRAIRYILPTLYYFSLLHSLVSRETVKTMLDNRMADHGFAPISADGVRAYVSKPMSKADIDADAEDKYELRHRDSGIDLRTGAPLESVPSITVESDHGGQPVDFSRSLSPVQERRINNYYPG